MSDVAELVEEMLAEAAKAVALRRYGNEQVPADVAGMLLSEQLRAFETLGIPLERLVAIKAEWASKPTCPKCAKAWGCAIQPVDDPEFAEVCRGYHAAAKRGGGE
jgi:hypothetical protein